MTVIDQMLDQYEINTVYDRKNAIKEIIQEIALVFLRQDFLKTQLSTVEPH